MPLAEVLIRVHTPRVSENLRKGTVVAATLGLRGIDLFYTRKLNEALRYEADD